jgi:uncharacterized protein YjiS (DUF1127 family)
LIDDAADDHGFRTHPMSDFTMSRFTSTSPAAGSAGMGRRFAVLRTALRTYLTRQALPELTARQALPELTVRELADIGVSSAAALAEAARLPWDTSTGPRRYQSGVINAIQSAWQRARTRRLLSRLQARELRDFGVSPSDAQMEATKPFWRS